MARCFQQSAFSSQLIEIEGLSAFRFRLSPLPLSLWHLARSALHADWQCPVLAKCQVLNAKRYG
jgi:hypothetical protein